MNGYNLLIRVENESCFDVVYTNSLNIVNFLTYPNHFIANIIASVTLWLTDKNIHVRNNGKQKSLHKVKH